MAQVFTDQSQQFFNLGTTTAGTQVKVGLGRLIRVVHGLAITGLNTISFYDGIGSTANLIVTMNTAISTAPDNVEIGATFTQGLYIVTSGITSPQLCIIYV